MTARSHKKKRKPRDTTVPDTQKKSERRGSTPTNSGARQDRKRQECENAHKDQPNFPLQICAANKRKERASVKCVRASRALSRRGSQYSKPTCISHTPFPRCCAPAFAPSTVTLCCHRAEGHPLPPSHTPTSSPNVMFLGRCLLALRTMHPVYSSTINSSTTRFSHGGPDASIPSLLRTCRYYYCNS